MDETIIKRAANLRRLVANGCGDPSEMMELLPLLVEGKQESLRPSRIRQFEAEIFRYQRLLNEAGAFDNHYTASREMDERRATDA
jgi:hypothetical protein